MYRLREKVGLAAGYIIFLFCSWAMLCKKQHLSGVTGFTMTGKGRPGRSQLLRERRSFLIQEKREGRETTQSNISRERRTSWVFPRLAESNPLEKRNIWTVVLFLDGLRGCCQVGSLVLLSTAEHKERSWFVVVSKSQPSKEAMYKGRTDRGDDFNHEGNFPALVVCS